MTTHSNLVAGKWEESKTFFSTAQGDFSIASDAQVDRAVRTAEQAHQWLALASLEKRKTFLKKIIVTLEENKDAILSAYLSESQLPEGRAEGEFTRTTTQILRFVEVLSEGNYLKPVIAFSENAPDLRKVLHPIGPIAVFGASNFPLAFSTAGGDTISAFAAGCPVIVKAHPYHPKTSYWVAKAIDQAVKKCDFPSGTFSHLQGAEHRLGRTIVMHSSLKGVGFTGSFTGGKTLYDQAQQRPEPIPVFAEMGSVNPVLLFPNALKAQKTLPQKLVDSIVLGSGQFCTNPGLLIAYGEKETLSLFEDQLAKSIQDKAPQPMVHKTIFSNFQSKLKTQQSALKVYGSVAAAIGVTDATQFLQNPHWGEEVFGPYSLLVKCNQWEEMEAVLHTLGGQLTLSLIGETTDQKLIQKLLPLAQKKAGRLLFEGVPTGVAVTQAMMHGGPFPASTDGRYTAVGTDAIYRWLRPISYQDCPPSLLPPALQDENPLQLTRKVNGKFTNQPI